MTVAFRQGGVAFPLQGEVIACGVELVLNDGSVGMVADDAAGMAFGLRPIGGSVGVLACRVGEAYADAGTTILQQRGLDAVDDGILVLKGGSGDVDLFTVGAEC